MTSDAQPRPTTIDIAAWQAMSARNLAAQWEHLPRALGTRWARWDDAWAADAASKSAYPNSATLLRPLAEPDAGELIERLDVFYAGDIGAPWLLWSAWPTSDLSVHGMARGGSPPLMVRLPGDPLPALPSELRVAEATSEAALLDFDEALIRGYPIDELTFPDDRFTGMGALGGPMHFFVGYQKDRPVTCAASYVGESEVGIYMVATLAEVRGKGYGGAITAAALASAPNLPAVLQASGYGETVYRRLGFQAVGAYTIWYKARHTR
jgi:ribosomal protein S18 acetylase RimI-like enzyme